jgi:hypothetical protein
MSLYNPYNVSDSDKFNADDYPKVVGELAALNRGTMNMPAEHKADMIISYLKDHCLDTSWIHFNPALAALITSKSFSTLQIESLFESCRKNVAFLADFETYINQVFSKAYNYPEESLFRQNHEL